jgi:hypothetical protein
MTEKQYNSEDQVALPGIRTFIREVLAVFFNFLSFIEEVVRKKKWFVIAGLILGMIFGFLYFKTKREHFKASMVVSFNKLTKKTYAEMLSQLDILSYTGSSSKLATELNLSEQAAASIIYVESKNINNEALESDTSTKIHQPFKIIVGILDKTYSDTIQKALIGFLNSRPLVKELGEIERKFYADKLIYIDRQLAKIDTLITEYNQFLATSKISSTVYNNAIDPATIFEQSNLLIAEKERTIKYISIESDAVVLIDGFKTTMLPQQSSLAVYLLVMGPIGLLLGLLIGLLIETKKKY